MHMRWVGDRGWALITCLLKQALSEGGPAKRDNTSTSYKRCAVCSATAPFSTARMRDFHDQV
eukprot:6460575-Prymnesium_polylepis.2